MINIKVNKREKSSSGYTNKLRLDGFIPAILYGGKFENQKISIAKKDVKNFIGNESFLSTVFEIELDGKREKVLPRDVAYHVTTNEPIHLDLMRIVSGTKIIIEIPVKFINNNESPGLTFSRTCFIASLFVLISFLTFSFIEPTGTAIDLFE